MNDEEDKQIDGFAEFCQSWPTSDVQGWDGPDPAELARDVNDGGVWTGSKFDIWSMLTTFFADLSQSRRLASIHSRSLAQYQIEKVTSWQQDLSVMVGLSQSISAGQPLTRSGMLEFSDLWHTSRPLCSRH